MTSFISSFFSSFTPSPELGKKTVPNDITHQTIRIDNDLDSLIQNMTLEINTSESIIQRDELTIESPKQRIKLQKYKQTLNKLIKSLQKKIESISDHSVDINDEMVLYLNESLQNVRILNNLCNQIYDNPNGVQTD